MSEDQKYKDGFRDAKIEALEKSVEELKKAVAGLRLDGKSNKNWLIATMLTVILALVSFIAKGYVE